MLDQFKKNDLINEMCSERFERLHTSVKNKFVNNIHFS